MRPPSFNWNHRRLKWSSSSHAPDADSCCCGFGELFWYVQPSYRGRVLIRGRRLDGPQSLGFNGGGLPLRELRIHQYETVSWTGQPAGSRGVPSDARVLSSGCYGVQIDGTTFSRIVVFTITAP